MKETKKLAFKTLAAAMEDPGEFLLSDFAKLDRSAVLHVGFNALDAFAMKSGKLPTPGSDSDAAAVVACAKDINDAASPATKIDDVDPDGVLTVFAKTAAGYLSPMCAMFGGVIGQEVVKACTGKFHPLHQWFYFDSIESLPAKEALTETELAAEGPGTTRRLRASARRSSARLSLRRFSWSAPARLAASSSRTLRSWACPAALTAR